MHGAKMHGECVLEQIQRAEQQRMQTVRKQLVHQCEKCQRTKGLEQAGHESHARKGKSLGQGIAIDLFGRHQHVFIDAVIGAR